MKKLPIVVLAATTALFGGQALATSAMQFVNATKNSSTIVITTPKGQPIRLSNDNRTGKSPKNSYNWFGQKATFKYPVVSNGKPTYKSCGSSTMPTAQVETVNVVQVQACSANKKLKLYEFTYPTN